jgi:hypothetical protein
MRHVGHMQPRELALPAQGAMHLDRELARLSSGASSSLLALDGRAGK